MERAVVVRESRVDAGRQVLRDSLMSYVTPAFFNFLFTETIIQMMVLMAAIFFIFLGIPVTWCLATLPIVATLVFISTYSYHFAKALEITSIEPMCCWIAEAYEPYLMTSDPRDVAYTIFNEEEFKHYEHRFHSMNKKVIGIVMVRDYIGPVNSLWMYGLAVDPRYHRKGIGKLLVRQAYDFCKRRGYRTLEIVITDLQNEARLFFIQLGFKLTHLYHKKHIGLIPLGKFQMGISTL